MSALLYFVPVSAHLPTRNKPRIDHFNVRLISKQIHFLRSLSRSSFDIYRSVHIMISNTPNDVSIFCYCFGFRIYPTCLRTPSSISSFLLASDLSSPSLRICQLVIDRLNSLARLANSILHSTIDWHVFALEEERRLGDSSDYSPRADCVQIYLCKPAESGTGYGPPILPNQTINPATQCGELNSALQISVIDNSFYRTYTPPQNLSYPSPTYAISALSDRLPWCFHRGSLCSYSAAPDDLDRQLWFAFFSSVDHIFTVSPATLCYSPSSLFGLHSLLCS